MRARRRLAAVAVAVAASSVPGCAVFHRGPSPIELRATATGDSLAATRDSLAMTRRAIRALDSLFIPLSFATPDSFVVAFETSRGRFDVMARSNWAPVGVDRFYELVRRRYFDDVIVFRIVKGFVAQFGISGDPAVSSAWTRRRIADDRTTQSNTRGRVSFASAGANTRTVQMFINLADNARLDSTAAGGYPPIAEVVVGMEVVDSLYAGYGGAPSNAQDAIQREGNAFLRRTYPKLDVIKSARVVAEWRRP